MVAVIFLAVLFLLGLFHSFNLLSHPKLRAWVCHLLPSILSFQGSHAAIDDSPLVVNEKDGGMKQSSRVVARAVDSRSGISTVFQAFDSDGDGFITVQELKESLRRIGILSTNIEVDSMVKKLDLNGDGFVDIDEFSQLYNSLEATKEDATSSGGNDDHDYEYGGGGGGEEEEKDMREAFGVFDKNGDGQISLEELAAVLTSMGLKEGNTMANCRDMIKKVDLDGDGKVSFEEFKKMMKVNSEELRCGGKIF